MLESEPAIQRRAPRLFAVSETVIAVRQVDLGSLESRRIPVHVFVPLEQFRAGLRSELRVVCDDPAGVLVRIASGPLLGPSSR